MVDSDLPEILSSLRDSPVNRADVSQHWSQGRSVYGGMAAALAVAAMRKQVAADRSLRSLMISFVGPLQPGGSDVATRVLREGGSASQTSAEITQHGEVCLQALAAWGRPRQGLSISVDHGFAAAADCDVPPPPDAAAKAAPGGPGSPGAGEPGVNRPLLQHDPKRMPGFLRFFDGAWFGGGTPMSGDAKNQINIWAAHRADMRGFPEEAIVAIADLPPPVLLNRFTGTRAPSSSLSWSLEFVIPPGQIETRWFLLRFDLEWAEAGYTQQSGKIFTETGQLAALSRQTMVYYQPKPNQR